MKNPVLNLSLILAALSVTAHAETGHGTGNGGDVVLRKGKAVLLDLVEAGYASSQVPVVCEPKKSLKADYWLFNYVTPGILSAAEKKELFKRLNCFSEFDRTAVLSALGLYKFTIIDERLEDVADERTNVKAPHFQVAIRRGNIIQIDEKYWKLMDTKNRVALLFHEAFYALLKPVKQNDGTEVQASWQARTLTADFYAGTFREFQTYEKIGISLTHWGTQIIDPAQVENITKGQVSILHDYVFTHLASISEDVGSFNFQFSPYILGSYPWDTTTKGAQIHWSLDDSTSARTDALAFLCRGENYPIEIELQGFSKELRYHLVSMPGSTEGLTFIRAEVKTTAYTDYNYQNAIGKEAKGSAHVTINMAAPDCKERMLRAYREMHEALGFFMDTSNAQHTTREY